MPNRVYLQNSASPYFNGFLKLLAEFRLKQIEVIILCGGGTLALRDKLQKLININIVVPNDPQFANARGYFKLGYVLRGEFERDGEKGA